jgi:hypothetical protein
MTGDEGATGNAQTAQELQTANVGETKPVTQGGKEFPEGDDLSRGAGSCRRRFAADVGCRDRTSGHGRVVAKPARQRRRRDQWHVRGCWPRLRFRPPCHFFPIDLHEILRSTD